MLPLALGLPVCPTGGLGSEGSLDLCSWLLFYGGSLCLALSLPAVLQHRVALKGDGSLTRPQLPQCLSVTQGADATAVARGFHGVCPGCLVPHKSEACWPHP